MVNPFDLKSALLAKHAQHVVLIHFPIALFISAVTFDAVASGRSAVGSRMRRTSTFWWRRLDSTGCRHRITGLAVATRRAEAEGRPVASPPTWLRFKRNDLSRLVDTLPRPPAINESA